MNKQYRVMLDIVLTETHFVEANSKEEAFQQARRESNAVADGGDAQLFEIEEIKG